MKNNILFLLPPVFLDYEKAIKPTYFPYFSLTCATHLKINNFNVKIIDYYSKYKNKKLIKEDIKTFQPDLIGICVSEPTRFLPIETHNNFIKFIKQILNSQIVIFGIFQKNILEKYIKNDSIDHLLYGDPEFSIINLAQNKLKKNKEVSRIIGIKNKDSYLPLKIKSLDKIMSIDYGLISYDNYKFNPHRYQSSFLHHMIITRGCPWGKCTFCEDMSLLKMAPYRYKTPENVILEIENIYKSNRNLEIQFYDPQFITDIEWLKRFSNLIKQKKLSFKWSCLSRADKLNETNLSLMKSTGCWNIIIGIETFCKHLLKEINKGISIEKFKNVIFLCKKYNIEITGSFLLGLPNEKPCDVYYSAKKSLELGIDYVQFFIAKYSDNHMYTHNKKYKISSQIDYSQYDFIGSPLILENYKNITHLKRTQKIAYLIFYFNFKTIFKMIKKIDSFQTIFRMAKGVFILIKISFSNFSK